MITPEQIRAARALLNWKQSDLAHKSGLSLPSINNIEREIGSPRMSTLNVIRETFQNAGIEFIGTQGIQRHSEIFEMKDFQGDGFIEKLNDDLQSCLFSPEDEILMYGLDERLFTKYDSDQVLRYDDHQKQTQFKQRILVRDDDDFFLTDTSAYRWIPSKSLGVVPYIVYHDRLVMIMWETKRTVIIRSKAIADTYRTQFDFMWEQAKPVPKNSLNKLDDQSYRAKFKKPKK